LGIYVDKEKHGQETNKKRKPAPSRSSNVMEFTFARDVDAVIVMGDADRQRSDEVGNAERYKKRQQIDQLSILSSIVISMRYYRRFVNKCKQRIN